MKPNLECPEIRELLPELSMDVLVGEERARALHHLAGCASCRRELEGLREVADELLLLAPSREPPAGFESRVLEQVAGPGARARPRRWRRIVAPAAAVLLTAAVTTAVLYLVGADEREDAEHYRAALEQAEGRYFGGIPLHDERLERVGTVFGYEGAPTWMVVVLEVPEDSITYDVVLITKDGGRVSVGSLEVSGGRGSWGRVIPVSLQDVARVRLIGEAGATELQADFPS